MLTPARLDPRDIAQERALAELEGRDPDAAERAYRQRERTYYDHVAGLAWALHRASPAPPQALAVRRSRAGQERRRAYSRSWWRAHGRAYRAGRRGPLAPVTYAAVRIDASKAAGLDTADPPTHPAGGSWYLGGIASARG